MTHIGRTIGHYEILGELGAGGMGVVYRARDTRLRRTVALKILPPISGEGARLARFRREAELVASLNHPNIVTVHSIEEEDGLHFLTMEHLEGETLEEVVPEEGLPLERFLDLATPLTDALAAAHRRGIIHRDLKPANVMVSGDDRVKVLDFGLAKLVAGAEETQVPTLSAWETESGMVLGTAAYMAPEQAEGEAADARSDVFSLGVIFYEMLSGRRPFGGETLSATLASILQHDPEPLAEIRPGIPVELADLVQRCFAKRPEERPASAQALLEELEALRPQAALAGTPPWRRGSWLAVGAVVLVLVLGLSAWLALRSARARWVRQEATPRIQELLEEQRLGAAHALVLQAKEYLPNDPVLRDLEQSASVPIAIRSRPPGAAVAYKPYLSPEWDWVPLGTTPREDVRVPATEIRWRAELAGHAPVRGTAEPWLHGVEAILFPTDEVPAEMVYIPPGGQRLGTSLVDLPGFWIDEHEVTNREFHRFVEDGGYRSPELWGSSIATGEAATLFVDRTGRPGPAGWSVGRHPEDAGELPVTGVSWHEAEAYCSWAGKSLPTVYHWRRAAGLTVRANILALSNFGSAAPAPVGTHPGISRFGAYDMAGNAAEWCSTATGERRYLLGGAWNEPDYLFQGHVAHPPAERGETFGFRCALYPEPPPEAAFAEVDQPSYDFAVEQPVSDDVYPLLASHYAYDPGPLDAVVEEVEETSRSRRETVTFAAAYGDERVIAHVFLPRDVSPPYQAVVYFPGSGGLSVPTSENLAELNFVDFIVRTGRALVYPVYDRMYERSTTRPLRGNAERRQLIVHWRQDLGRTLDYLETRDDIDPGRIGFFGLSLGAIYAPNLLAVEERIRVAVLVGGGLEPSFLQHPPELYPLNFAPRVEIPVLMITGRNDFIRPVETAQRPLFRHLGAPEDLRRFVVLDGGHVPEWDPVIRESLDWLDRHLGPVSIR